MGSHAWKSVFFPKLLSDPNVQLELRSIALAQCSSNSSMHITHLEISLNEDPDSESLRWGSRFCISNRLSGVIDGVQTTLPVARLRLGSLHPK